MRPLNRHNNQISARDYVLKQICERVHKKYLPSEDPEKVKILVEAIHYHEFKELNEMAKTKVELEITNFGKLKFSKRRAEKLAESIDNMILNKKESLSQYKIDQLSAYSKSLKEKIIQHDKYKASLGGMEK